eukprot:scaffold4342_cov75-Skeletonema_dohrnii-CCMP3373.AAC.1
MINHFLDLNAVACMLGSSTQAQGGADVQQRHEHESDSPSHIIGSKSATIGKCKAILLRDYVNIVKTLCHTHPPAR